MARFDRNLGVVVMRKKIVDQICRGAPPERAARARALAQSHGNLIEELLEVGFPPDTVLETCSAVTGIPLAPVQWLKSPRPPQGEIDGVLCRAVGAAPVASKAGRLCIAYGDVEMAAQHASLGLPPHEPYLALRAQLETAIAMLPPDDAAETRIATTESLRSRARSSTSRRPAATSGLEDPTESLPALSERADAGRRAQAAGAALDRLPDAGALDADATYDSPREHDSEAAADALLDDDPPAQAGTPLPPPSAPPPSAGMIGAEEPWRRPFSGEGLAIGRAASVPVAPGGAMAPVGAAPPVPIAGVPPAHAAGAAREQSERTRRPAIEVVPVVAANASAFGAPLPPGVTPAIESSRPRARNETSAPTRRPSHTRQDGNAVESSSPSRRPSLDDGALETPTPAIPPSARAADAEVSGPQVRRASGFSIERSRSLPTAAESLDPLVAPDGRARRPPPQRPFETLDPHVEPSGPVRRAQEASPPTERAQPRGDLVDDLFVDDVPALAAAPATAPLPAANRLVPVVVVVLAVAVVAVVVVVQEGSRPSAGAQAGGPPPPLAPPVTAPTPGTLATPASMDGKVVDDVATRQAELIGRGQKEADHKKAVALFDQAIRLSPQAPGSRTALLEKAQRLLLLGQAGLAQDAVMQLKRRNDVDPIEEQIEHLLEAIQELRQKK